MISRYRFFFKPLSSPSSRRYVCAHALLLAVVFFLTSTATPQTGAKVDLITAKKKVQKSIDQIQGRQEAMEFLYGAKGAARTLDLAYTRNGVPKNALKNVEDSNAWLTDAWNGVKPFYVSHLKDLEAAQVVFAKQGFAWQTQLDWIEAGMKAWEKDDAQLQSVLQEIVDLLGRRPSALVAATATPAQQTELRKKADSLKADAAKKRTSSLELGSRAHLFGEVKVAKDKAPAGPSQPTTAGDSAGKAGTSGKSGKSGDQSAKGAGKSGKGGDKSAKSGKGQDKGKDGGDQQNGGEASVEVAESSVTVCKCKLSEYPFRVQTINETVQSTNPEIAIARIRDGRLEITGKKRGEATITVKGEVVRYNAGFPEAPPPGKGGIHGNGPNEIPLSGNHKFENRVHVKVSCDLNGSWHGPAGRVTIIDACGKTTLTASKSVYSGTVALGAHGYDKMKLNHSLVLDEISPDMPDPVRQQVVGRPAVIEATVAPDEESIQGDLVTDKVVWKEAEDGSYSVTFPKKEKLPVVFTRNK